MSACFRVEVTATSDVCRCRFPLRQIHPPGTRKGIHVAEGRGGPALAALSTGWLNHCAVLLAASVLLPAPAVSEEADSAWTGRAILYGWLPSVDGETRFGDPDTPDEEVDVSKILESIDTVFMGAISVRMGNWGLISDYIYLDLSDEQAGSASLNPGRLGASLDVGYSTKLQVTGYTWNLAGFYSLVDEAAYNLDIVGGLRYLDLEEELILQGAVGDPPSTGHGEKVNLKVKDGLLDGVVGLHGNAQVGGSRWYVPYYLDIGTGDSDYTWQALSGIGYAFQSLDFSLTYRHLEWHVGSNRNLQSLSFSGPLLGVGFRW